jgi:hypothetical protein
MYSFEKKIRTIYFFRKEERKKGCRIAGLVADKSSGGPWTDDGVISKRIKLAQINPLRHHLAYRPMYSYHTEKQNMVLATQFSCSVLFFSKKKLFCYSVESALKSKMS